MNTHPSPILLNAKALTATALLSVALSGTASASIVIAQLNTNTSSGTGDYGQLFQVDSALTGISGSATLESLTFYRGGNGSGNLWIDVYSQGTETGTPNFSNATNTGNLDYRGSSSASIDYTSVSAGDPLTWTFSGVTLPVDTNIYLVLSTDSSSGNWTGRRLEIVDDESQSYNNIVNLESDPLFGGSPDAQLKNDNRYSVVVIPEPSAAAALLGTFAVMLSMIRRRNRRER